MHTIKIDIRETVCSHGWGWWIQNSWNIATYSVYTHDSMLYSVSRPVPTKARVQSAGINVINTTRLQRFEQG